MTTIPPDPAEEFYAVRRENALILEQAARRRLAEGDAAGALVMAWGADLETWQAVAWERLVVVAGDTPREFFGAARGALGDATGPAPALAGRDCEDALRQMRRRLVDGLEPALARTISATWPDSSYLAGQPLPSADAIEAVALRRLAGLSPRDFMRDRRERAAAGMLRAHEQRVSGDIAAAIQSAYAADVAALEAYLVESAEAAGDLRSITVETRWELATRSLASLKGLPPDFPGAVAAIRGALSRPLGDSDGARFLATLQAP